MNKLTPRGIDRAGLNGSFADDETLKSNLIVEGQLLNDQHQPDAAADRFAQAAEIEERLSQLCESLGLHDKSRLHLFSAASCWARAGNFHAAICLGEQLLDHKELQPRLRGKVQDFTETLRQRRIQWATGLALAVGESEPA